MAWTFRIGDDVTRVISDLARSGGPAWQASVLRKSRLIVKTLGGMDFDERTRLALLEGNAQLHAIRALDEGQPWLEVGVVVTAKGAYAFHAEQFHTPSERWDIRSRMIQMAPLALPWMQERGLA